MEQNKKPVDKFYYSEQEWDRLGCGPLPEERKRAQQEEVITWCNPVTSSKTIKVSN